MRNIDVWETVEKNVQLDGPRAKPVRVTFSMTESPTTSLPPQMVVVPCRCSLKKGGRTLHDTWCVVWIFSVWQQDTSLATNLMIHCKLWSVMAEIKGPKHCSLKDDNDCWCFWQDRCFLVAEEGNALLRRSYLEIKFCLTTGTRTQKTFSGTLPMFLS